jgi:hypothetical protein
MLLVLFEESVLAIAPASILLLLAPLRVFSLVKRPLLLPQDVIHLSKLVCLEVRLLISLWC